MISINTQQYILDYLNSNRSMKSCVILQYSYSDNAYRTKERVKTEIDSVNDLSFYCNAVINVKLTAAFCLSMLLCTLTRVSDKQSNARRCDWRTTNFGHMSVSCGDKFRGGLKTQDWTTTGQNDGRRNLLN